MQITSLVQVINYMQEKSGDPSIIEGYRKLSEMLVEPSGNNGSGISPEILAEKMNLKALLLESDPADWGAASYSLFEKMNKDRLFGRGAADHLDVIINPERESQKTISSDLKIKSELISKLPETLSQFMLLFNQLVPSDISESDSHPGNDFSMYLYFGGNLSVKSIAEMERYSELWAGILNNFSQLTGEKSQSMDIAGYNSGNFTLGVQVNDKTLSAVSTGVVAMLSLLPVIQQIRKTQIEIARLPLNKDFNPLLDEEIQALVHQKARETALILVSDNQNNSFDQDDMINDLSRSLKQILNFIEQGGKIEFNPRSATGHDSKTNRMLNESFALAMEIKGITDSISRTAAAIVDNY